MGCVARGGAENGNRDAGQVGVGVMTGRRPSGLGAARLTEYQRHNARVSDIGAMMARSTSTWSSTRGRPR